MKNSRHTAAVHHLEAGVEVNVIRGWLGHVSLETTNRYAEITVRMKEAAVKLCEPPVPGQASPMRAWRDDAALLTWLASLRDLRDDENAWFVHRANWEFDAVRVQPQRLRLHEINAVLRLFRG